MCECVCCKRLQALHCCFLMRPPGVWAKHAHGLFNGGTVDGLSSMSVTLHLTQERAGANIRATQQIQLAAHIEAVSCVTKGHVPHAWARVACVQQACRKHALSC